MPFKEYFDWCSIWLSECKRVLKPDGRIAINIPIEISNPHDTTYEKRVFILAEYYSICKKIDIHFAGIVRLNEKCPQRVKFTAFGSWMSSSSPYIYSPEECVLLGYKKQWKRLIDGESTMTRDEFLKYVTGNWDYTAETKGLTMANYSLDFPLTALKMLSYKEDVILDPFMGSGTTGLACVMLGRQYIGFEISKQYHKIAEVRIQDYIERKNGTLKTFLDY